MKNILILCTGNSCRSQLAEGYLKKMLDGRAMVYSAGIETHGVNPRAIQIMAEEGIDISAHTSNHIEDYQTIDFDYIISVCDHAKERCPIFPSKAHKLHHNFPDPAQASGTETEILASFRHTRDLIKIYLQDLIKVIENNSN